MVSDCSEDRFAARLLQDTLHQTHGIDCQIVPMPAGADQSHQLWLSAKAKSSAISITLPSSQTEAYNLQDHSDGILISTNTDAGLFYGTQTLTQLLEQSRRDKAPIPALTITDWPTFPWRGRYFDASQYAGTIVPTRANLEREIKLLARYKMNCLCFDAYNLVPLKSFPYCADANTLSAGDWEYLVELAHRYHVTLMPSVQSFAQVYQLIWTCDEGKPYREETCPGLICPSRPEGVKFLQGVYRDLMTTFKYSPIIGIGCSEVGMQWDKHYCPLCQKRIDSGETLHDIFYKHVQDCVHAVEAAAKEVGRPVRPMMWADEFYLGYNNERWVDIEKIPKNTIMGHWQYWSRYQGLAVQTNKNYDGISGLLERGFDVFCLPASFEYNDYLHDLSPREPLEGKPDLLLDSGIYNIAEQARWEDEYNHKNYPGKAWGGVCATFSQHDIRGWDSTWYAYALEAEYTWGDPKRPLADVQDHFTDSFAATFYGARDRETVQTIAAAYRQLDAVKSDIERNNYLIRDIIGEYDIHDEAYIKNDLEASLKLIDDLTAHPKGPGKTIADIRQRAEHNLEVSLSFQQKLAQVAAGAENGSSMHYLISAAHKMENHSRRTLLLLDLSDVFQKLASAKGGVSHEAVRQTVIQLEGRCESLQAETRVILDEMNELTHAGRLNADGVDTSGYQQVLESLNTFDHRLRETTQPAQ